MDDLELALDDCLQQLASGKLSLAQCLARYPRYAAELRPMLEAALRLQQARNVRPSGAMRDRTRAALARHIKSNTKPKPVHVITKPALVMLSVLLLLLFTSTTVVQAAMPGDGLYTLKLSMEQAWRAASPDPVDVDLSLANRRTAELLRISKQLGSKPENAAYEQNAESQGIAAYTAILDRLDEQTQGPRASQILSALQNHQTELSQAGIHVPKLDELCQRGNRGNGNDKGNNGDNNGNGKGHNNRP